MIASGLRQGRKHLAAQHVEELRGRGEVADLDVVLGAVRQEALEPRARVLGPLALVPVRQEQHEPGEALPLVLARRDELVDDDLRAVQEVAELGLPDDERLGVIEAVAELEAEDAGLGQRAVVDVDPRPIAAQPRVRRVRLAGLRVEQQA
jgi:hypothetical protein